jgi:hypothetical protein
MGLQASILLVSAFFSDQKLHRLPFLLLAWRFYFGTKTGVEAFGLLWSLLFSFAYPGLP